MNERETIARYFGHDRLNVECIDTKPITFDFYHQPVDFDGDGEGRWRVAQRQTLDDRLEDLETVSYQADGVEIHIDPPDKDGDVTIVACTSDGKPRPGWIAKARKLADAHIVNMDGELDDNDDDERDVQFYAYRDPSGLQLDAGPILTDLFGLDPEIFDEDDADRWEPVMNYAYPLGRFDVPEDWTDAMRCTTIVYIDDEPYLALTGGGMDLSWEICEAYLMLGLYPPAHFCDLPRMAGRGDNERDRMIVRACMESVSIARGWLDNRAESLQRMLDDGNIDAA